MSNAFTLIHNLSKGPILPTTAYRFMSEHLQTRVPSGTVATAFDFTGRAPGVSTDR